MRGYVTNKKDLLALLDKLALGSELIAPNKNQNFTTFSRVNNSSEIVWGAPQSIVPPKKYFFPPNERLLSFNSGAEAIEPAVIDKSADKKRIIFGIHPCDLNAIYLMDRVFDEKYPDELYKRKRTSAIIIGIDCLKPCFSDAICFRMDGLNPKGRFDAFLTEMGKTIYIEIAASDCEDIFSAISSEAAASDTEKLEVLRKKRDELFNSQTPKLLPNLKDVPKLMKDNYNSPEWEKRAKYDYACGSCNMVCPTCSCFDVKDYTKADLSSGTRVRIWDSCMTADFALVATGENFRDARAERLRHRTYRKLYYLFEKYGESFCTGCGRCIKSCLTKIVNPLEIANALYSGAGKAK